MMSSFSILQGMVSRMMKMGTTIIFLQTFVLQALKLFNNKASQKMTLLAIFLS